jgi:predicted regulator of Ras-like GTPase activity (Roadblock/LC7/MglB family)
MYQQLLERLLAYVKGSEAALLLDAEGELVVQAGQQHERHRLIGAYQGLTLASLKGIAERCQLGPLRYLVRRHQGGSVVIRPLKDGYYLVLSMSPDVPVAPGVHQSERILDELNEEL